MVERDIARIWRFAVEEQADEVSIASTHEEALKLINGKTQCFYRTCSLTSDDDIRGCNRATLQNCGNGTGN